MEKVGLKEFSNWTLGTSESCVLFFQVPRMQSGVFVEVREGVMVGTNVGTFFSTCLNHK